MAEVVVKFVFPFVFFMAFLVFCIEHKNNKLRLVALFFTSIVAFSQNFAFVFREIHQAVQLLLVFFLFVMILKTGRVSKLICFMLFFLGFIIVSLLNAPIDSDAVAQSVNFIIVFLVLVFLYTAIHSLEGLHIILKYFGLLGLLLAVSGVVEFAFSGGGRIEGTFANPNYFALFVSLAWVPVYTYFGAYKKCASLAIMTIVIILSGSRAALIIPFIHFVWTLYKTASLSRIFIYGTILFVFVSILLVSGLTRFSSSESSASDAERIIFAKMAINMAVDNPVTGVGWGRFISEFSNYSTTVDKVVLSAGTIDASKQDRRVTHNDFLRILSELGFIAFFASIFYVFKTYFLISKNNSFGVEPLFACWFGVVFFSLTHNNLNTAMTWFFLLLPWFVFYKSRILERCVLLND